MTISPNGYFLALISGKDVVVYNFEDKKIRTRIDAEVPVTDLVFSPDASSMALLTDDGLLSVYDTRTFDVRTMVDDLGSAMACDFNADGKYVAVVTSPLISKSSTWCAPLTVATSRNSPVAWLIWSL